MRGVPSGVHTAVARKKKYRTVRCGCGFHQGERPGEAGSMGGCMGRSVLEGIMRRERFKGSLGAGGRGGRDKLASGCSHRRKQVQEVLRIEDIGCC